MSDTYECAACHETFEKAWTDEEAAAEFKENFYGHVGPTVTVCDDCFEKMTAVHPLKMADELSQLPRKRDSSDKPPTMAEETLENPHLHTSGGDPRCDICVALVGL